MSLLFLSFGLMARSEDQSFTTNKGLYYLPLIYTLVLLFFLANFVMADLAYSNALHAQNKEKLSSNIRAASDGNKYSELYRQGVVRYYYSELNEKVKTVDLVKDSQIIIQAVELVDSQIIKNIEMFPSRVSVWESKGAFYRELLPFGPKALGPAIGAFEKAKSFDPNNPILLTEIGTLYLAAGEVDKADENVSKAITLRPDHMPAILQRALIMERRDKINDAIALLESALGLYPQTGIDVAFQLGRLYYRAKRFADAKAVFESVINIAPNNSDSLFLLGEIYKQSGNRVEANKYFQKVLDLNPGNPEILKLLREEPAVSQTTTKSK
jgi:tetratricopeptide (TPR) repeat protein